MKIAVGSFETTGVTSGKSNVVGTSCGTPEERTSAPSAAHGR